MMKMIRIIPVLAVVALFLAPQANARALTVGLAIPLEGTFHPLGDQVRQGFSLAVGDQTSLISDIVEGEDRCDAESGVE